MKATDVLITAEELEIVAAAAVLMPDDEQMMMSLKKILEISLSVGRLDLAEKIIGFLGGHITNAGLIVVFNKCLELEHLPDAQRAVDLMTEPEKTEHTEIILNKYLHKNLFDESKEIIETLDKNRATEILTDYFDFYYGERKFKNAQFMASLMFEPERTKNLKKTLRVFVRMGDFVGTKEISEILGQKIKDGDLITILKKAKEEKRLKDAKEAAMAIVGPDRYFYLGEIMEAYLLKDSLESPNHKNNMKEAREIALKILS